MPAKNSNPNPRKSNDFETWGVKEHVFTRTQNGRHFINLETGQILTRPKTPQTNRTWQRITLQAGTEPLPS